MKPKVYVIIAIVLALVLAAMLFKSCRRKSVPASSVQSQPVFVSSSSASVTVIRPTPVVVQTPVAVKPLPVVKHVTTVPATAPTTPCRAGAPSPLPRFKWRRRRWCCTKN